MLKILKWLGLVLGGLVVLLLLAAAGLYVSGGQRLNKTQAVQPLALAVHNSDAQLARGEHLVKVGCISCHGPDLSGQALMDEPAIGRIFTANITGLSETHTDADLVRAIRHGIGRDGRQLIIMPSEVFIHFSAEDLSAVIAYLKTIPRTGGEQPKPDLAVVGRILLAAGLFGEVFPAEYIDHSLPFPPMPEIGANPAYGEYLSRFCTGCHGPDLTGAQPSDPDSPPAPSLRAAGTWTEEQFIQTLRTGITPSGRQLDPQFMPWDSFGKFHDEELRGLWLYLRSLN